MVEGTSISGLDIDQELQCIQFASLDPNSSEIVISDDAMSLFSSLPCDLKLSIVTLIGSIDSCKTSLANRIFGKGELFKVREEGSDPKKSSTQGITMLSKPLLINNNQALVVLDMQGLPPPTP